MLVLKVLFITIILLSIAFAGLAIRILLKKKGKFPHTHIGGNKEMAKRKIVCARTFDRMEQKKVKLEALKKLQVAPEFSKNEKGQ